MTAHEVLVTGGAGYIGSTVASACLDAGITPVLLDDLSAGRREFVGDRAFYHGDIADRPLLRRIFDEHPEIGVVVHCAARIVVPESVLDPLRYYRNNVAKTVEMLVGLGEVGCGSIVFSSSASIYAPDADAGVDEESALSPTSPYARTKAMTEQILQDAAAAGRLRVISLRYFNPIGADPTLRSGLQTAEPTHALGRLIAADRAGGEFRITGTDWPTRDGSGIRDYVHVWDLARAHVTAIDRFAAITGGERPYTAINLGTGSGTTVRELVDAFRRVTGRAVPVRAAPRRPGDAAGCFARGHRAGELLGWEPELALEAGIADSLRWAQQWPERPAGTATRPD